MRSGCDGHALPRASHERHVRLISIVRDERVPTRNADVHDEYANPLDTYKPLKLTRYQP